MENRVRLEVLGITYNQIQNGAYVLVLAEMDGPRRIPIVIGTAEAQSIVMRLGNKIPPRPMTHDLFVSFAHGFGVRLVEVFIYSFKDGIFASELLFDDGERQMRIDSRTSDAIAIALRTQSPIYTTPEILAEAGRSPNPNRRNRRLLYRKNCCASSWRKPWRQRNTRRQPVCRRF